jgi:hypothetical protein
MNSEKVETLCFPLLFPHGEAGQILPRVLLDISSPPFIHGQLHVAFSCVRDCRNIRQYVTDEQLIQSNEPSTGYMPIFDNTVYHNILDLNRPNHDAVDEPLENLI